MPSVPKQPSPPNKPAGPRAPKQPPSPKPIGPEPVRHMPFSGIFKKGGKVKKTGVAVLHKGEHVKHGAKKRHSRKRGTKR